jgi:hypothetical protein
MVNYTNNVEQLICNPPDEKLFEDMTGLSSDMVKSIMPLFEHINFANLKSTLEVELKPLGGYNDVIKKVGENLENKQPIFEGIQSDSVSLFRLAYSMIGAVPSNDSEDRRQAILKRSSDVIGVLPQKLNILTSHPDVTPIAICTSLKELLSRNNKRWGNNYHLSSAHDAIMEYLDNEIKSITTNNVVHTIDENFYSQLIEMILFDEVPPMYRSINYIKTQISDIQTLIFDLMVIITSYIRTNGVINMLSRRRVVAFAKAADALYTTFITSLPKSHVYIEDTYNNNNGMSNLRGYTKPFVNKINTSHQYYALDVNMQHRNILECMYMMKACSEEVSIMFRKIISDYLTKAYSLLTDIDRIQQEKSKFITKL